jgi:hypothetical protein
LVGFPRSLRSLREPHGGFAATACGCGPTARNPLTAKIYDKKAGHRPLASVQLIALTPFVRVFVVPQTSHSEGLLTSLLIQCNPEISRIAD